VLSLDCYEVSRPTQDAATDTKVSPPFKIIAAHDSVLFRERLSALLDQVGHEVIEQVPDAPSLSSRVKVWRRPSVDLIITDIRMPPHIGNNGLNAWFRCQQRQSRLPIIALFHYSADALQWITASGN